jgi:hypothetical protein
MSSGIAVSVVLAAIVGTSLTKRPFLHWVCGVLAGAAYGFLIWGGNP